MENAEFSRTLETTDQWIRTRTGISSRHIAAEGETASDLAVAASLRAMENANVAADEIDLVVVATSTPDRTFPSTAAIVQGRLNIKHGAAFDIQAACSGYVYALSVADSLLRASEFRLALVIGTEVFSRILDWSDRSTCVLFGDGAGALVVRAGEGAGVCPGQLVRGVIDWKIRSDGAFSDRLCTSGGVSSTLDAGVVKMDGRHVFRTAISAGSAVIASVLESAGCHPDDLDWFVPHQANIRIMQATCEASGIGLSKLVSCVDRHANTSAASIPLALDVAVKDGRIRPGHRVLVQSVGGGYTWGAALIVW